MTITYDGLNPCGSRAKVSLGALRWEAFWGNRYEGNLHFPDGTHRVYLEPNPRIGLRKDVPALFIKSITGDVEIGVLFFAKANDTTFCGRINTATPLPLVCGEVDHGHGRRFVISAVSQPYQPLVAPKNPVSLILTPYPEGETWRIQPPRKSVKA